MTNLLLLSLLVLAADVPRWELAAEADGIQVFARQRPGVEVRELKAISLMDATPHEIRGVIRDYGNNTKAIPYTVEAKELSKEQGGKLIYPLRHIRSQ
jgi:KaiC/GvpD/RAD55 family RecA-like ATPase